MTEKPRMEYQDRCNLSKASTYIKYECRGRINCTNAEQTTDLNASFRCKVLSPKEVICALEGKGCAKAQVGGLSGTFANQRFTPDFRK